MFRTGVLRHSVSFFTASRRRAAAFGAAVVAAALVFTAWPSAQSPSGVNLTTARWGHTTTGLSGARVFVAGGANQNGLVGSTEILDLAAGQSSAGPPLLTPRSDHTATLLGNGLVLIAGGTGPAGPLASTEVFDPATGTVVAGPAMTAARAGHTATMLGDGSVLIVGGDAVGSAEIYRPGIGFLKTGGMATARSGHGAALLADGTVLAAGGANAAGTALNSVEIYSPANGSFAPVDGTMQAPRVRPAINVLPDGKVQIIGGDSAFSMEMFDPDFAQFKAKAALPPLSSLVYETLATASRHALLTTAIGGNPNVSGSYDWALDRDGFATVGVGGQILVVGGASGGQALASGALFPASSASVTTDFLDYNPGSPVAITGTGWTPGETVTLFIHQEPQIRPDTTLTATADGSGAIKNWQFATVDGDVNTVFTVTARGSISGYVAQTAFGDGPAANVNFATLGLPSATSVSVSYSGTNNGGHATSGTATFTSPGPSSNIGTDPGSVFSFTFPTSVTAGSTTYNFVSASPASGFHTGAAQSVTTVTATYQIADSTPPVITPNVSGTAGSNGWYTSDVNLTWSVTDPESSISSKSGCDAASVTSDTTGTTFTCTATSAGGTASRSIMIKRDATLPTATLAVSAGTLGSNGWYTTNVTVHTSGTASVSGFTCTGDQFQTTETTGTEFNGSCTNAAGVTANATPLTIKLDKTAPTGVTLTASGTTGSNGWYTGDVTVQTSGTDNISGIASCSADQYQKTDTAGATFYGSCTNNAGLTSDQASLIVKRDATPPTASLSVTAGTPGENGWYITDVTIHTSGTGSVSGVTCTPDQTQTAETTGATFNGSCTSGAGLTTNATALTIKLDKTAPTGVALSITAGTAGANGWYTSDVTVHTSGQDSISGVTCTADQYQTTETAAQAFNGSCTNGAGLKTDASPLTVKLDKTAPTSTLSVTSGTAGKNGWYTSDVTVSTTGSDDISGVANCSADQHQTTETTGTTFNGSCTNNAGLTGNAAPLTVKLDKTAPTGVSLSATGKTGKNGWYTGDVTVHTSGTDTMSAVTCTADQVISTDTTGTVVNGSCENQAGLQAAATPLTVKLDKTAPVIAITTPGSGSSYTLNQTVQSAVSCTDATSGVATCVYPQYVGTGTVGSGSFTVQAEDQAGNTATLIDAYTVLYAFGGMCLGDLGHAILQPIKGDWSSVFKSGSTVPTKFRVCDANGNSIGAAGVVAGFQYWLAANGVTNEVISDTTTISTNDLGFRWDPTAQQWIMNMTTNMLTGGTKGAPATYGFRILLNDGSKIDYYFGVK